MTQDSACEELRAVPVVLLPLSDVRPGPLAMRAALDPVELNALALSLSAVGQLNPIQVHAVEDGYEVIAGHRRCAAAEGLGWTSIEARVVRRDLPALWSMAWAENEARAGVAITDRAEWLSRMQSTNGWTQSQLAEILGIGRSHLSEILGTLDYPPRLREALDAGAISHGVARTLARCSDPAYQEWLIDQAAENGCTVRFAEEMVRNWKVSQMPTPDVGRDAPDAVPAPGLLTTCACCHQTSRAGLLLLSVCPSCADAITAAPVSAAPP